MGKWLLTQREQDHRHHPDARSREHYNHIQSLTTLDSDMESFAIQTSPTRSRLQRQDCGLSVVTSAEVVPVWQFDRIASACGLRVSKQACTPILPLIAYPSVSLTTP